MSAVDFLRELHRKGISVSVDGDELEVSAPRNALSSELRQRIAQNRSEIIRAVRLLREFSVEPERIPALPRRDSGRSEFAMSSTQQRLWLLHQLFPDSPFYNLPMTWRLRGPLNVDALQASLNGVVARHEALRTSFRANGEAPLQMVLPPCPLTLGIHDLSSWPEDEREAEAQRRVAAQNNIAFDLSAGPLVRAQLLRLDDEDHVLQLTLHHVIADDWSRPVLGRDLGALYQAHCAGRAPALPPLPVQYADFSVWQRQRMTGDTLSKQLEYWRTQLAGMSELQLPTDQPRPALPSFAGARETVRLSTQISAALRSLAQREGATLYMVLLAAFNALLQRYTRQDDLIIGSTIANRTRAELENLVGSFINNLVIRTDASGDPPFAELLARVRGTAVDAYAHQDLPFQRLVEALDPHRDLSRNPLFQVMFSARTAVDTERSPMGPDLTTSDFPVGFQTTHFDLEVHVYDGNERLRIDFIYSTDLFVAGTIRRMLTHFERLLEGVAADPQCRLSQLPLLSDAERHRLLEEWNDTAVDYPRDRCAHQLFEAKAAHTPDAVAVCFEDRQLPYGEVNARANRLARRLVALGVGREVLVGLCVERTPEMVIGLLAILKAGGAYVPIDPKWPPDRVRLVAEDAGLAAIVTVAAHADRTPPSVPALSCDLGAESDGDANLELSVSPADAAYVLYTSGTTSLPKGVLIEHRQLVQYVWAAADRLDLEAHGNYAMLQPLTVDSCHTMIFPAIGRGGTLHLISEERALDARKLAGYFAKHPADYLKIAPSHLAALLDQLPSAALLPSRALIVGGEASHWDFIDRLWSLDPQCAIWNHYGPTETTVGVSVCKLDPLGSRDAMTVPIGRPLPNVRFYVLDQNQQPVPPGLPGELCVGGKQIARGYLNHPDLTAEKFIPDPFSGEDGARLYRTGDQVRYLPDGNVEFLARIDDQLKIRGFRIEPAEIEAVLCDHPAVRQALVLARELTPGDTRLVAYVVPADPATSDTEPLRTLARDRLPDYMRPAAYVLLERLPLSPHGKVDRKALPAPDAQSYTVSAYKLPVGEVETGLAAIWAEMLRLDKVGRDDNFFELGGHSLLAVSVIERMRRAGLHIDIRTFFATPTVAALAAQAAEEGGEVEVPPNRIPPGAEAITPDMLSLVTLAPEEIERVGATVPDGAANVQDIYALTPLQEGILFHRMVAREGDPYQAQLVFGFDSRERLDGYVEALQAVVNRHDILRTAVLWEGLPEPVQVVWRRAQLAVEEVSLDAADGDAVQQLMARFASGKFRLDLSQAPLLRLFIAHDAKSGRWLMLQVHHHLAIDQTTMEVMQEEVLAHLEGRGATLPTPVPYRNFVAQARLEASQETHEAFFTDMLADMDEQTTPFGLTDVHGDGSDVADAWQWLDASLAARLREGARSLGVGLAALFHLAWAEVLARVSSRDDVVFGTVLFGRVEAGEGGGRAPGLFMNTLPMRMRMDGESVEDAVRRTHILLGQLLNHEHAPLALAQRCSALPAPTPLFSALLNCRRIDDARGLPVRGSKAAQGWPGIEILKISNRTNYPLLMSVNDFADGIALDVQVQSPVDPERVCAYMHTALEQLAEALESAPSTPLTGLDVMPVAERHQLLAEWNDTARDYPGEQSIHQLFEAQARRAPEAIALAWDGGELGYGELNARANRLAHHLTSLGVGPDTLVGVCLERSPALIVSLLGILKAGGAYMPLDPSYPPARLGSMLADAEAPVLITRKALVGQLPSYDGRILCLDRDRDAIAGEPDSDPPCRTTADNLAYVIFTSGSTGRPKGILLPHATLVNLMTWHGREATEGRVAQFTSISFDVSLQEMFDALLSGKTLFIVDDATRLHPDKLAALLEEKAITDLFVPNVVLEYVAQAVTQAGRRLPALAHVYQAGEALTITPVIRAFFESHRDCRLHNHYGPAESHVVTAATLPRDPKRWPHRPVIGAPIANSRIYILDRHRRPMPVGVAGELYIGGPGLARGYLNRPDLTAERFGPDPFAGEAGARLYRTGDLARFLPDGNIEFLGRLDDQVKIRGFRIEPREIEAVLTDHPSVRQAVVQVREATSGDKRLVAYVVPVDPAFSDTEPLRGLVRERLPHFMRPAAYVVLEELPLTANGKIDHQALPAPDGEAYASGYEAPVGETETALAEIWADVLHIDKVGRHDNFFELGGDSLLAVQMVSRMHERTQVDLPLLLLFKSPTLATLAERFAVAEQSEDSGKGGSAKAGRISVPQSVDAFGLSVLSPIERIYADQFDIVKTWRGHRETPESLIVTCNVSGRRQGLFWCLQAEHELTNLAKHLGPDQPVHGMRSGHLVMEYSPENVEALVEMYSTEMLDLQPEGSFLIAGNCQGGSVAHALAVKLRKLGRAVSLLILMEVGRFRPYDGPVALIFGRDSVVNPYGPAADPEAMIEAGFQAGFKTVANPDAVFKRAYPAGFTLDFIEGLHGTFFTLPNVESLAAAVRTVLLDASDRQWVLSHLNKAVAAPRNRLEPAATWSAVLAALDGIGFDIPSPDDFDEAQYLSAYLDVAEACRRGTFRSGYEHYVKHGRSENRQRPGKPL